MVAIGQTFTGIRIVMDGGTFVDCVFEKCTLHFSATLPVTMERVRWIDSRWEFGGPAAHTLEFLKSLYVGGGKEVVEATLNAILSGSQIPFTMPTVGNA